MVTTENFCKNNEGEKSTSRWNIRLIGIGRTGNVMAAHDAVLDRAQRARFFAATNYHIIPGGRKKLEYIYALVQRLKAERPGFGRVKTSAKIYFIS
ncbi:MAG: hypothetical protein J5U17_11755 [Candidatus Methanoperedens sp.]|nr:hypothetical protein [Candidatus Methanoperedens sp.]MCE8428688.1 hypothetical protein [Candidatus Methanoperedens sp.]